MEISSDNMYVVTGDLWVKRKKLQLFSAHTGAYLIYIVPGYKKMHLSHTGKHGA